MSRPLYRRWWVALRRTVLLAGAFVSLAVGTLTAGPVGASMLLEARVTRSVDGVAWVVSQPEDCADALRRAQRLAHRRGRPLPDDVRLISLGETAAMGDELSHVLRRLQRRVVTWPLWLRGVRQTPVVIEYPPQSRFIGSIVVLQ